jgi:hypothetical protein
MNIRRTVDSGQWSVVRAVCGLLAAVCCASALGQVAVSPWKSPHVTFTDPNGVGLAGGCVFTYTGGTSTPLATYTDSTGGTANPNPVILDATGSANIWLGPSTYKFAIWSTGGTNCASGALEWSVDEVPGNIFNNTTITGGTWTGGTITGAAISGGTITGAAITNSTIDSSPIGQTTPSSGVFTSLAAGFDAMAFSSTPVFPAGTYGYFTLTLTNNVTSSSITGGTNGQLITFDICQNGTGQTVGGITTGFTFAWPASYLNPPIVNPILDACTIVTAYYDGGFWTTVSTTPQLLAGNFDTVPYSATPIFPAASYSNFALTLTGNVTSSTITGGTTGQVATADICQDATGGHTFVWPTNLLQPPPVSAGANTCTGITAVYNGTNWTTVANSSATTTTPLTGNLDVIPFTATPIYSTQSFSNFEMVLAGNVTSSSISGGTAGQLISIVLKQGSSTTTAPASAPTFSTLTTGGALPGTTTYYTKCSYLFGTTESLPSAEASETTGSGATNSITWNCPVFSGVTTYKFYIGTGTGAENYWFTTSSASYVQIGVPSTGTPGLPFSSSTYTVAWPSNLLNPPVMTTGIGASTGLIAAYDGTNWNVVGTSGTTYSQGSNGNGYWVKDPLNHYHMWDCGVTLGASDTAVSFPVSFTSTAGLTPIPIVIAASGNTGYVTLVTGSITTSAFTLHQNNQTGLTVCWTADGY